LTQRAYNILSSKRIAVVPVETQASFTNGGITTQAPTYPEDSPYYVKVPRKSRRTSVRFDVYIEINTAKIPSKKEAQAVIEELTGCINSGIAPVGYRLLNIHSPDDRSVVKTRVPWPLFEGRTVPFRVSLNTFMQQQALEPVMQARHEMAKGTPGSVAAAMAVIEQHELAAESASGLARLPFLQVARICYQTC
jgi:hypothetical protein